MSTLFAIATQYRDDCARLADMDLPEDVITDTLESLGGELETKVQNIAHVIRAIESESAACSEWAKTANNRARAAAGRANALRKYLGDTLQGFGISKVSGPGIALSFRASTAVEIEDASQIPAEYLVMPEPQEPRPDKLAISAAIKAGKSVPGARLEQRSTLQIK